MTSSVSRERGALCVVCIVVFVVQMLTLRPIVGIGEPYFIAQNLSVGLGFSFAYPFTTAAQETCFIPPLYVWFHSGLLSMGLSIVWSQVLGFVCIHLAAIIIYYLFSSLTSKRNAFVGFLLFELYLPFWILGQKPDPDGLNILLVAAMMYVLIQLIRSPQKKYWMYLGVLYGIQLLVRPDILVGIAVFSVVLLLPKASRKGCLLGCIIAVTVALMIVVPWTVRNYTVFGKFALVSANSGYNFYLGNNRNATGEFYQDVADDEGRAEVDAIEKKFASEIQNDIERDSYLFQLGKQWVLSYPLQAIRLAAKKFVMHWWSKQHAGSEVASRPWMVTAYNAASIYLALFGFIGLFSIVNRHIRGMILALFLYSTLISVIFFVQSRHRAIKVDPFLIPLSVIGVERVISKFSSRKIVVTQ